MSIQNVILIVFICFIVGMAMGWVISLNKHTEQKAEVQLPPMMLAKD